MTGFYIPDRKKSIKGIDENGFEDILILLDKGWHRDEILKKFNISNHDYTRLFRIFGETSMKNYRREDFKKVTKGVVLMLRRAGYNKNYIMKMFGMTNFEYIQIISQKKHRIYKRDIYTNLLKK